MLLFAYNLLLVLLFYKDFQVESSWTLRTGELHSTKPIVHAKTGHFNKALIIDFSRFCLAYN